MDKIDKVAEKFKLPREVIVEILKGVKLVDETTHKKGEENGR